ncbi:antitoxin Xre/MbcA/ParS toxin-binding domain-containing protein [Paracoccus sp. ME4]|uniref:antitoxin Xre/MbcA/ParS toxin-binding domain-containing protein n=1 Tax=Paracoccus sp. ME4 TaxID=3138066 RepID=UPI00398B288B
MAKSSDDGIGVDLMDMAPDSFETCPRCWARASVVHEEPCSGGGRLAHLHVCRRCRHKWWSPPASWLLCPLRGCDAHGLDATGLGGHRLLVHSALIGELPEETAASLLRSEAGLREAICPDRELLQIIRALWTGLGHDLGTAVRWLHNPNTALGGIPARLLTRRETGAEIIAYLASRQFPI